MEKNEEKKKSRSRNKQIYSTWMSPISPVNSLWTDHEEQALKERERERCLNGHTKY